jgi:hypothetical protein
MYMLRYRKYATTAFVKTYYCYTELLDGTEDRRTESL